MSYDAHGVSLFLRSRPPLAPRRPGVPVLPFPPVLPLPAKAHLLCVGGEDHALRIPFLLALRGRGFRVTAAGTGEAAPFAHAGIDYRPYRFDRFANPFADWSALHSLRGLMAELQPDLVQCFDTKPNLLVPLAARTDPTLRVVRTINGMGWLFSSRSPAALSLRPAYRALHRLAVRSTAATIFQNRDDQGYFERHRLVGRGRSVLIPGSGIDIAAFERDTASATSPAELRRQLGLGSAPIVLTVTRLTRQKGIPALLEAAALVHQAQPDVRFVLVGPRHSEGPLAVSQAEIERHAPYVIALGPRSDVPALLGLADVFAFPTEYREGVPRALLEAALAGLPIVATRMPGCTDVVDDGYTGLLVPPRAPKLLAAKILTLLRHTRVARVMGRRAADLVQREFGLDLTVARYERLYSDILSGPSVAAHAVAQSRGEAC